VPRLTRHPARCRLWPGKRNSRTVTTTVSRRYRVYFSL
jgi:hypothetical protein